MSLESVFNLSKMSPPKGSRKRKIRLGRGESSGHGKTCGRGGKGQKGRKGVAIRAGFEGGQMPLYRRLPKLGFFSRKKSYGINTYALLNLSSLESFDAGTVIDNEFLAKRGIVRKCEKVKLLGTGKVSKKFTIKLAAASASAKKAIEAAGGSFEVTEVSEKAAEVA